MWGIYSNIILNVLNWLISESKSLILHTHTHYTWALAHWQLHLVSIASQPIWWWCCFFQCSSWELSYYYYMKWQANVVFIACVFEFITTHGVRSEWSWNGRRNAKCAEHPFVVALCKPHTVWHTHHTRHHHQQQQQKSQMLISNAHRPLNEHFAATMNRGALMDNNNSNLCITKQSHRMCSSSTKTFEL